MGEAAQLKQRGNSWKISKSLEMSIRGNEVITNTAVRFQGRSKRKVKGLKSSASLMNEGMDKHPKHQPFRPRLINWNQLMRSERRMMSSHHSPVPHFSTGLCFCDYKVLTPNSLPPLYKHTQTCIIVWGISVCARCVYALTIRERWGTFSNVSSKCQLKITRVLEKVGSEGTDIFSFLTQQCLSGQAAGWHDGMYFVSSLIHSDKAAPVNINERNLRANM